MSRSALPLAAVIAISAVVLLTNLGGPRLWDRDEPRNASCAAEMMARNDWIVPVMNGELRTHKPIMLYWVTMAFYAVWGVNEFTARLGSALAGIGTVVFTYFIGVRLFNSKAAFWGALALATMLMFNVASRAATPDALLIFFSTATVAAFVYALSWDSVSNSVSQSPILHRLAIAPTTLMYLAAAGAVLTKGPVGVVVPLAIAGMYLMTCGYHLPKSDEHRWSSIIRIAGSTLLQTPKRFLIALWQLRPVLGIAIILAVAAPWYVWVGIRTQGHWPNGFFFEHNLSRFSDSMEGHSGSIFYYPIAILVGSFPWSVLLIPICLLLRKPWPADQKRGLVLCFCWVGVIVGLFSLAQTKLPSYVTPCYPAIGLLCGWFLSRIAESSAEQARKWLLASASVLILVGLGIAICLPIAASIYAPRDLWLGILGLAPLIAGGVLIYAVRKKIHWTAPALATCAAAMMLGFFAVAADRIDSYRRHEELFSAIEAENESIPIATWGVLEPSWVFYSARSLEVVETNPLSHRVVESKSDKIWHDELVDTPKGFLARNPDGILVTTRKLWEREQTNWADQLVEVARAPYFLKNEDLVALQTRVSVAAKAKSTSQR